MLVPKIAQSHFPNLHCPEIDLRGAPLSCFYSPLFTHTPNLLHVLFSGYQLPHENFWEQINVLKLSSLPVGQCLKWDVLLYAYVSLPNLTHLISGNSHPLLMSPDPTVPPSAADILTTFSIFFFNYTHSLRFIAARDAEETIHLL
jgi:hypothetical protein